MAIEIPLTKGQVAIVDDIDGDLAQFKWQAQFIRDYANGGKFVAQRGLWIDGKTHIELMHRVILSRMLGRPLLRSEFVDHIHGRTLDNRRSELRLATNSQNQMNRGKHGNNTSGYKGVTWNKRTRKWRAQIMAQGEQKFIGEFRTPEEAHEAYKKAAVELHGEFARFE